MNQDFCSLLPSRDGSLITVFVLQMQTFMVFFNYHAMFVFACVTLNFNNFGSTPWSNAVTTQLLKLNCHSTPVGGCFLYIGLYVHTVHPHKYTGRFPHCFACLKQLLLLCTDGNPRSIWKHAL